jgi:hypothetical protein
MGEMPLEVVVRSIDRRLEQVEQLLPRLATKDELLVAVAPLATKGDLQTSIAAAIAPVMTRREPEDKFRQAQVKSLQDSIRLVAETLAHRTAIANEGGRATRRRPEPSRGGR